MTQDQGVSGRVAAGDQALLASLPEPVPVSALSGNDPSRVMTVPWLPTEAMWGGLARQLIMWLDMGDTTPRALFRHLDRSGYDVPDWLRADSEMQRLDHVPSKGTRAVLIYQAMLEASGIEAAPAGETVGLDRRQEPGPQGDAQPLPESRP